MAAAGVFAMETIGDMVKNFDFSKLDVKDNTRDDFLHIGLAPSFGNLKDGSTLKMIDDELLVMIASTFKDLDEMPADKRTWESVTNAFMQNPCLEPDSVGSVHRSDKLIKQSSGDFKFDGSPDSSIVQEVLTWFTNLIDNPDVLSSTQIDSKVMADIVAQTGATITSFEDFFYKQEEHTKDIVDIGVLRYPDIDRPYFQVYRIKLYAWSKSTRFVFHQEDSNGIVGEYYSQQFKPRQSVMRELDEKTKMGAVAEARKRLSF